jgi:hypothetical protein
MLRHNNSAPVWLFSFVDLAFLLLIAFTQISPESDTSDLIIGQLTVPQIISSAAPLTSNQSSAAWQLRVHPLVRNEGEVRDRTPFELIEPRQGNTVPRDADKDRRIDASELTDRLQLLRDRKLARPVLAPHRDSRSEDLLIAVGLLEEVWQGDRRVTVIPGNPVASGPASDDPARQ